MGLFSYKDYSNAEAAALVGLSLRLTTGYVGEFGLPDGWKELTVGDLKLPGWMADSAGYIKIESPLTGWAETGPQVKVFIQRDAMGQATGMAISFAATNSPVDIPDYFQLPTGEIHEKMGVVLDAVRGYAQALGLTGADVLVTGFSLGGGMANVMARFADTLSGGFFAQSDYISHDGPIVWNDPDRVLNVGWENDVVYRVAGDSPTFIDALLAGHPGLVPGDYDLAASVNNLVLFDDGYAMPMWPFGLFSLLNIPGGWGAHLTGSDSDGMMRIGASGFYNLMDRDAVVVVSALSDVLRPTTWVYDKSAPSHDARPGAATFVIGTDWGDMLKGGRGTDYLEGGAGDDLFRTGQGGNRVDGGTGTDTLRLEGFHGDWTVYRMADGTLFFAAAGTLTEATNIERVDFEGLAVCDVSLINWPYSVQSDRLEDEHWSLFEWGDNDVAYSRATEGTGGADVLTGRAVFGRGGDDRLSGTAGADLLHGGDGNDRLVLATAGDRGYGAEGNDVLIAAAGGVRMNGGLGADTFVFQAGLRGEVVVEDFDALGSGDDVLMLSRSQFSDPAAHMVQDCADVLICGDGVTIRLAGVDLAQVSADDLLLVA